MASGKSTVACLLAQSFPKGVHVEADVLQQMVVSGSEWVSRPGVPTGEAANQLRIRLKNMCLLGRSFFEEGFSVVLDDIIIGDRWHELQTELSGLPFSLVVLAPSVEVVTRQRDRYRRKSPQGAGWAAYLDQELRSTMAGIGLWIDSSAETPAETVAQILSNLDIDSTRIQGG
jgi:chloramphenicol 3-O-phosphotransferase